MAQISIFSRLQDFSIYQSLATVLEFMNDHEDLNQTVLRQDTGGKTVTAILDAPFSFTSTVPALLPGTYTFEILGEDLTYKPEGTVATYGIRDTEKLVGGFPESGTITSIAVKDSDGNLVLEYDNARLDAGGLDDLFLSSLDSPFKNAPALDLGATLLSGVDTVYGSSGDDSITINHWGRTNLNSWTVREDGDDIVMAGAGNDYVEAGSGEDVVFGEAGDDTIYGDHEEFLTTYDFTRHGSASPPSPTREGVGEADQLYGGDGNDIIYGRGGDDLIDGGSGDDTIFGGHGSDTFLISTGDDIIDAHGHFVKGGGYSSLAEHNVAKFSITTDRVLSVTEDESLDGPNTKPTLTVAWQADDGSVSTSQLIGIDEFIFQTNTGGEQSYTFAELVALEPGTGPGPEENIFNDDPDAVQHLTGTLGSDVFVIDGGSSDYGWGQAEDGIGHVVWGNDSFDVLHGFEKIRFDDIQVNLSDLTIEPLPDINLVYDDPHLVQHLTGTADKDAFVIDGESSDYGWDQAEDGVGHVVWSAESFDVMHGFEEIRFNDQTVDLTAIGAETGFEADYDSII